MKVAYFVHNLGDPAVLRRTSMLAHGGVDDIVLFGFRRDEKPVSEVGGVPVVDFGRTVDGGFANRIRSIASAALSLGRHRERLRDRTVFVGRNLEGLQLAAVARRRFAPGARLAYECLDIHRLMLGGPAASILRWIEGRLLRRSDVLMVSSPSYSTEYFAKHFRSVPPTVLVENKVLETEVPVGPANGVEHRPMGPPWRIGWYGSLRCRYSLHLLSRLANRLGGKIEVIVRGVPSALELADFDDVVASTPHMRFLGRYDRATDLGRIYADIHFAWAIDRFEKGGNGEWQLVNRLYEGGLLGSVMIAERTVEMGRWLKARGTGVLVGEPLEDELVDFFETLDRDHFQALETAARSVPVSNHVADAAECRAVVRALGGYAA